MPKKKNTPARYAFIGLIVAGLGCLGLGVVALLQGTIALRLFTPPSANTIPQALAISAGVIVVGLAAYSILNPESVRRFISGRQARYGSNALVMSLAFILILIIVNVLVYQNPKTWDLTEGKSHTLAPQSIQALNTLPEKVTAIAFFSPQTPSDTARQLLTDFQGSSKGKFDFRFVDPTTDPLQARQYGITRDGQIVLTMGKATETASSADESSITEALARLINPQARTVYFMTGHGEPDVAGTGTIALTRASQTLTSKNYTVKTLNLAAENKVPDDAKTIIIVGPQNPLLDSEVALLKAYLDKGGALVIMEDPTPLTKIGWMPCRVRPLPTAQRRSSTKTRAARRTSREKGSATLGAWPIPERRKSMAASATGWNRNLSMSATPGVLAARTSRSRDPSARKRSWRAFPRRSHGWKRWRSMP